MDILDVRPISGLAVCAVLEDLFVVYRLKKLMHRIEPSGWKDLPNAGERIGTVRVDSVRFDEGMRKSVDAGVLLLLPEVKKEDL